MMNNGESRPVKGFNQFLARVRQSRSKSPARPPVPIRQAMDGEGKPRKAMDGEPRKPQAMEGEPRNRQATEGEPRKQPFGSLLSRLSFRRLRAAPSRQPSSIKTPMEESTPPRAAFSECDLRTITFLDKERELTARPLNDAQTFYSEENLSPRLPSYLRISCALNGYTRRPPLALGLVERRLAQLSIATQQRSNLLIKSQVEAPLKTPVRNLIAMINNGGTKMSNGDGYGHTHGDIDQPKSSVNCNGDDHGHTHVDIDQSKSSVNCNGDGHGDIDQHEQGSVVSNGESIDCSLSGQGYRQLAEEGRRKLESLVKKAETMMNNDGALDETECDALRLSAGKANLLLRNKLATFDQLVHNNLSPNGGPKTTVDDLAGYWALVERECIDVESCFARASNGDPMEETLKRTPPSTASKPIKSSPPSSGDVESARDRERRLNLAELKRKARRQLRDLEAQ